MLDSDANYDDPYLNDVAYDPPMTESSLEASISADLVVGW